MIFFFEFHLDFSEPSWIPRTEKNLPGELDSGQYPDFAALDRCQPFIAADRLVRDDKRVKLLRATRVTSSFHLINYIILLGKI